MAITGFNKILFTTGIGPRETNASYYNRIQNSYISFGVYYFSNVMNKIVCSNIDLVINDATQTAYTAIRAFKFLRSTDIFKSIDCKNYTIWFDCGNHFRYVFFI